LDNVRGGVHIRKIIGVSPDNERALLATAQPVQLVPETTRISNGLPASRCTSRWGNEKEYYIIGVMKSGGIGEMGSYEELMAKKGLLCKLATGRK